jgi:LmbE family N-acetylglucosaminyl deacetylase
MVSFNRPPAGYKSAVPVASLRADPTPPRPPALVDAWGTSEAAWIPAFTGVPEWPLTGGPGRALVVAPHPDDETLGAGGLLATLLERGWEVLVVAVTDGEAAYGSSGRDHPELAARRRDEQAAALRALAGGNRVAVHRLGLDDGGVSRRTGPLADAVRCHGAGADLCIAPLAWDGHPDHDACGEVALAAARDVDVPLVQYPIWAWHWGTPSELPLDRFRRVVLSAGARARKQAAMACFVSQQTPPPGCPTILPPHVMARFERPFEVLLP